MSFLRDLVLRRRDELLAELAECDQFLIGAVEGHANYLPPQPEPSPVAEPWLKGRDLQPVPIAPPPPSVIVHPGVHRGAQAPDPEAAAAAASQARIDGWLKPGGSRPGVLTKTDPATGTVVRIKQPGEQ